MRIGSLFSGIGGLELGLEMSGIGSTVWQVEQNEYCKSVLARHWPMAERFDDVTKVGRANLSTADLICGGFPCQDISSAGKGAGLTGSRSGLWFEYLRIVDEMRPRWVVVENVASGASKWVDAVCDGLEQIEYETLPVPLSARDVGAPHIRERVFVMACNANAHSEPVEPINEKTQGVQRVAGYVSKWPEPGSVRVVDGVSCFLDRMRALGNAVVPQCAEVIGHMIIEMERNRGT